MVASLITTYVISQKNALYLILMMSFLLDIFPILHIQLILDHFNLHKL